MLDPDSALTRPILWVALAAVLTLLVVRSVTKDRKQYQRFKRYRSTAKRQAMFRKWLLESFLLFGGLSAVTVLLTWDYLRPLLQELTTWPVVQGIRGAARYSAAVTAAAPAPAATSAPKITTSSWVVQAMSSASSTGPPPLVGSGTDTAADCAK